MQVAARDKVAAAAEEALGHPYGLCIEFTGLVSWTAGAAINWHHDSNR
jgi:procollagen-proline 3-dioxygenase 1